MRNSVVAMLAAGLLGGAAAFGIGASQSPSASIPLEQHAEAAAAAQGAKTQLPPAASTVITQETIDCTVFNSGNECQVGMILRAPSPPPPGAEAASTPPPIDHSLHAVLIGTRGEPVPVTVKVECATGCIGQTVRFYGQPATAVNVILTLPARWRYGLTPRAATGLIGVATNAKPGEFDGTPKRLRVLAPAPSNWQSLLILVSGSLALGVGLVATVLSGCSSLLQRMGAPSWSAANSWGTNLTVGGGLVNGVVTLAVLTETTAYMTKSSYTVLSMVLASFVLLAPIVYGLFRREVDVTANEFEGYVVAFIVAGSLTLWASVGQLMTFALLIGELRIAGVIGTGVAVAVMILVAVVTVGLLIYGFVAMVEAAKAATEASTTSGVGRESGTRATARWSLL